MHCQLCKLDNDKVEKIINEYNTGCPLKIIQDKFCISSKGKLQDLLNHFGVQKRDHKLVLSFFQQKRLREKYNNLILCNLCGKYYKELQFHLLKIHSSTVEQYKNLYGTNTQIQLSESHILRSKAAIEKYKNNPELLEKMREVGTKNITLINERGLGWKMPKGYHTEEHKIHMSKILSNRNVTWNDKIKQSHWTKSTNVDLIIDKIIAGNKNYKRGWYVSKKNNMKEFFHSSYEERRMKELDHDSTIISWTKKHGIRIDYIHMNKKCVYIPDFLIKTNNGLIILEEVKGYIRDKLRFESKCLAAIDFCTKNNMKFDVNLMSRNSRYELSKFDLLENK